MARLLFRNIMASPITVSTYDFSGQLPATNVVLQNGVFIGEENDAVIINLLARGAIGPVSAQISTSIPAAQVQELLNLADLSDVASKTGTGTTVVMQTSPTLTTPSIASFTGAAHNHQNAAGAGTLDAAAIASGTLARGVLPTPIAYEDENNSFSLVNDFSGTLRAPRKATPGSPAVGELYVDGADLKFRDNQGSPANQTVERLANKAAASGYASLDGSTKVVQNPASATATPTASSIPISDGSGKLAAGWGGAASSLATLNGSSKVVENPASATATPTATSIPISDGSGKLASGWGGAANSLATLDGGSKVPNAQVAEVLSISDLSDVSAKTGVGTVVVMQDTPTLTTPTIASFTNATHNHQTAAGGGALDAAAVTTGTFARGVLPSAVAYEDEANTFTLANDFTSTLRAPRKTTPGSPVVGEMYVDGADLKYRDNQGSPANQTVERLANKAAANGYASLDGSTKVPVAQISEVLALADLSDVTAKTGMGTTVVMDTNATIVTPTIASFVNATHTHQNAAGGGTLTTAAIASGTFASSFIATDIARWTKVTKIFSDFTDTDTTNDIEVFSLPAKGVIQKVVIKHNTAFTGGTISAYTISVGIASNFTKYAAAKDVFAAASDTNFGFNELQNMENFGAATSIRAQATSTGGNLNAATTGSVDIYIYYSVLP